MEDFGFLILFITFLIMAIGIFAASIIKLPNKEEADSDNKKETQADKSIGAVDNDSMKSNANTNNENQDLNGEAELYEKMLNATQNQIQNETTIRNEPQKSVANGGNMKGRNVAIAILIMDLNLYTSCTIHSNLFCKIHLDEKKHYNRVNIDTVHLFQ